MINQGRFTLKYQGVILNFLCIYIILTFFYGFLIILGNRIELIEDIRKILPEIFLSLALLLCLFNYKVSKNDFKSNLILFLYFTILFIINLTNAKSLDSILISIRDVIMVVYAIFFLSSAVIADQTYKLFLKRLQSVFKLFLVVGLLFASVQQIFGWEWTSSLYTGYSFYGVQQDLSLRISHGSFGFMAHGTTGSSVSFGLYSVIAIVFILNHEARKPLRAFYVLVAACNILLSGNKTALIILIVLIIYDRVKMIESKKLMYSTSVFLLVLVVFICLFIDENSGFFFSFRERFRLWQELISEEHLINLIIPLNLFNYAAKGNIGLTSFWDNTYIFLAYSFGILGLIIFSISIYKTYKLSKNLENEKYVQQIVLVILLSSLTTCIFFGRSIMIHSIIMLSVEYANIKYKKIEGCISP